MVVIGLTGGIGAGKSTALAYLRELGASVWDADEVSRSVVEPGRAGAEAIRAAFGPGYFDEDGRLRREKLGDLVFRDEAARAKLNGILHPAVLQDMDEWLERSRAEGVAMAVVDVPLLFETGVEQKVDEVWVVSCGVDEQLRRVMARGLSQEEAQRRIEAQMPDRERRRRARRVIDTNCPVEDTRRALKALYEEAVEEER